MKAGAWNKTDGWCDCGDSRRNQSGESACENSKTVRTLARGPAPVSDPKAHTKPRPVQQSAANNQCASAAEPLIPGDDESARGGLRNQRRWRRDGHCVAPPQLRGQELWLDGLNVLTAVETALGGGVILIGRDGCCRDVAGIYSHYHKVAETVPALRAIGQLASQWAVTKCHWWLDSPVDNSGRLKGILHEVATEAGWPWQVELVTNPDRVLSATDQIVSSSDHAILDRCQRWFNLARQVITYHVPQARIVDLGLDQSAQAGG